MQHDLPIDTAVSMDWIGCRALDVLPVNAGADETMTFSADDLRRADAADEWNTTTPIVEEEHAQATEETPSVPEEIPGAGAGERFDL